jgi:hypothetical protein
VDLGIDSSGGELLEQFKHASYNNLNCDGWTALESDGRLLADPGRARKWRVERAASQSPQMSRISQRTYSQPYG